MTKINKPKGILETVYAYHCNIGGDQPIVAIYNDCGKRSEIFIQPEELTVEMRNLWAISEAVNTAMIKAVEKWEQQRNA